MTPRYALVRCYLIPFPGISSIGLCQIANFEWHFRIRGVRTSRVKPIHSMQARHSVSMGISPSRKMNSLPST
jgi:hypothetical protein